MEDHPIAPAVVITSNVSIPTLGLGTWPMDDETAESMVAAALKAGYRLIDTAENYANEVGVGRGIRRSEVPRNEVFITTKFNREWHSFEGVQRVFAESSRRLSVEYIDLLLIHWPNPEQDTYVDAWRGMISLFEEGKLRSIGVSNFLPKHIQRLIDETGFVPHVNQIELNPWLPRKLEQQFHDDYGIVTECWSPLGQGSELIQEPVVVAAAENHGRTPAQVVLRWHVQLGLVPIPRTQKESRLSENLDVFDFELLPEEMESIASLDRGGQGELHPDSFGH